MDVRSKTSWCHDSRLATQKAGLTSPTTLRFLGFVLLIVACAPDPLPDLVLKSAKFFKSADDAPVVITQGTTVAVPAGSFAVLEFNQQLDGNTIQKVNCEKVNPADPLSPCRKVGEEEYKNKIEVVNPDAKLAFTPLNNVVVTVDGADCLPADCLVSYRPSGGFNPPPETKAQDWPLPAVRVDFVTRPALGKVSIKLTTAIKTPLETGRKALPAEQTIEFTAQ